MRRIIVLLLLLLSISIVSAQQDWYYNAKELIINSGVDSSIKILRQPGANIDYIIANVTFVPKDRIDQDVLSRDIEPMAYEEDGSYVFRWDDPAEDVLDFKVQTRIRTKNNIRKINDKIAFPIKSVDSDVRQYLEESEHIDITPEIVELSSSLAAGKDDLYEVVFELAKWTKNNIKYDLGTLTAEVSQPASWVLKTRLGVCDELTNLFIAMCRSLGIPARFISGIAYTDAPEFPEAWGAHGWAEVYFPNYGWVPFDPTYGEFGYVDPTHVILQESQDSDKAATYYEWRGHDFNIQTETLNIETGLESSTGVMPAFISLRAQPLYDEVGFGSYNLIEARVENPNDFYVATELGLSKSSEVEIVSERFQQILLRPNEERLLLWIVKLSDNLDRNYIYTFPFAVYSTRNSTAELDFKSTVRDRVYDYGDVKNYYDQKTSEAEKEYSASVDFQCVFEKNEYFVNELANVNCIATNTGNVLLSDIEFCAAERCEIFDLGITRSVSLDHQILLTVLGEQTFTATLENDLLSKAATFDVAVFDKPDLLIDVLFPERVDYDQMFFVNFSLKQDSLSVPANVVVVLDKNGIENQWHFEALDTDKIFEIKLLGNELVEGENIFKVKVFYEDKFGRKFQKEKSFIVLLEDLTFGQKVKVFFNKVSVWIEKMIK
ncbi:transglutaminase-like domain-containing protein [Candidatus Woesearchaeota archaeon]|nr:transglutaminase-like domain-containing protein [Candidatus Woesearchaeota archaeon]